MVRVDLLLAAVSASLKIVAARAPYSPLMMALVSDAFNGNKEGAPGTCSTA